MKNHFTITISRVLTFIGEILRKSAQGFLRNLEFCNWFYPIPMGFTTVTNMCIYRPMSWSVLGPNIVWITGKTSFIHE